jgi:hypothetical protein
VIHRAIYRSFSPRWQNSQCALAEVIGRVDIRDRPKPFPARAEATYAAYRVGNARAAGPISKHKTRPVQALSHGIN